MDYWPSLLLAWVVQRIFDRVTKTIALAYHAIRVFFGWAVGR